MSKFQALRALVSERLAAAAEDIFVLFERTMAEYEEELSRSKEENWRKQQLLDSDLTRRLDLVKGNVETTETPQIKQEPEQSVRLEKEQLPEYFLEPSGVCVKHEESPSLQQSQTEQREEPSSHLDNGDGWRAPFSFAVAQMETDADGDRRTGLFLPNRSQVHTEHGSGAEAKKHQCPVCYSRFQTKKSLQFHIRVHTGERPYSCLICNARFTQKSSLNQHQKTHTGERPYSCDVCGKTFAYRSNRDSHLRIHTGEKPYSCSSCDRHFADPSALRRHRLTHTGEKPHSCFVCNKAFARKYKLNHHLLTHCV